MLIVLRVKNSSLLPSRAPFSDHCPLVEVNPIGFIGTNKKPGVSMVTMTKNSIWILVLKNASKIVENQDFDFGTCKGKIPDQTLARER